MELIYRIAADGVVVLHLAFILFVFLGGLTLFRWPWMIWIHVPAAVWGGLVEFTGAPCPLTFLENHLITAGNAEAYSGGFIDHYIMPIKAVPIIFLRHVPREYFHVEIVLQEIPVVRPSLVSDLMP